MIFKNFARFTNCISKINNIQVDKANVIEIVIPTYNLIEYSDDYLKTSGNLWKNYGDEASSNSNDNTVDTKNNRSSRQQWHKKS